MTEPVVVVPSQAEQVLNPEAQGHAGVGIVAADDEDERVDGEEGVGEWGQRKAARRDDEHWARDQDRKDLEPPRGAIVRRDARHEERRADDDHENSQVAVGHWVQVYGDLSATIRCSASAAHGLSTYFSLNADQAWTSRPLSYVN